MFADEKLKREKKVEKSKEEGDDSNMDTVKKIRCNRSKQDNNKPIQLLKKTNEDKNTAQDQLFIH